MLIKICLYVIKRTLFAEKRDYLHETSYIQMWRKNYISHQRKYRSWNVNMNLLAFIHVVYLIFASANLNSTFRRTIRQLLLIKIQTRFRRIYFPRAQQIWFIVALFDDVRPFASTVISKNHYWILKSDISLIRDIIARYSASSTQYHLARSWMEFFFFRMKDVRNHRNILTLVSGYDLLPYRRQ